MAESADRMVYIRSGIIIDDNRKDILNYAKEKDIIQERLKIIRVLDELDELNISLGISKDIIND